MACKDCKNKDGKKLNEVEHTSGQRLTFIVIMVYTCLAVYGLIRLILDIQTLINTY